MSTAKKLAWAGLAILCLYLLSAGEVFDAACERVTEGLGEKRMKNVCIETETYIPAFSAQRVSPQPMPEKTYGEERPEPSAQPEPSAAPEPFIFIPRSADAREQEQIMETTIQGGLSIKNETEYWVDAAKLIAEGPHIRLDSAAPQILIIHTHSSEAYTQAGLDRYEASDASRTENTEFNIVRIGDELTEILQSHGLNVIHDRGIYDYPSYTGSYTRSGEAVARYLQAYPEIAVVIDMHRDALGSDGIVYKTMAEEEGVVASQVMLLVGTDESGLEHPDWRENLSLALYLQNAVHMENPTLMRPVSLVRERYNQHLSKGFFIMEVGSSGNTLQEALAAVRLFGSAAAPAFLALVAED